MRNVQWSVGAIVFWSAIGLSLVLYVVGITLFVQRFGRRSWLVIAFAGALCGVVPIVLGSSLLLVTSAVALVQLATAFAVRALVNNEARL